MRERLISWLLSHLLRAPNPHDVLWVNPKTRKVHMGGEQGSEQEACNLKAEAILIKKTRLWQILNETLTEHARKTMFEKSTSFEDMRSGKLLLFARSMESSIVDTLEKL